jgi:Uma2 family endonuclease
MNVQLPARMDKPAFLAWVQDRGERYELVDGRVVMMVGASRNHGRIVSNLVVALRERLDNQWEIIAEFGLDAGPRTLRYPDIVVDRAGGDGADYTARAPALLIEVLSPSSVTLDMGDKAAEYLQLPSLQAYLVLAQDMPKAWLWLRGTSGFSVGPAVIEGVEDVIRISALDVALAMSAVYKGIFPA